MSALFIMLLHLLVVRGDAHSSSMTRRLILGQADSEARMLPRAFWDLQTLIGANFSLKRCLRYRSRSLHKWKRKQRISLEVAPDDRAH